MVERFVEHFGGPEAARHSQRVGAGDRAATADGNDRHARKFATQLPDRVEAVLPRHEDVAEDQVRFMLPDAIDRFATVGCFADFVAFSLEDNTDSDANGCIVVDHEDALRGLRGGVRLQGRGPSRALLGSLCLRLAEYC